MWVMQEVEQRMEQLPRHEEIKLRVLRAFVVNKKTFNRLFTVIPRLILVPSVGNEKLPGSVLKSAFLNQSGSNTP